MQSVKFSCQLYFYEVKNKHKCTGCFERARSKLCTEGPKEKTTI